MVFHRLTDREVVEILKVVAAQAEQLVKFVIEIAADARGTHAGGFGFQVQHLAENSASQNNRRYHQAPAPRIVGAKSAIMPKLKAPSEAIS